MDASPNIRAALSRTTRWLAIAVLVASLIAVVVPVAAHAAPGYIAEQAVAESCGASTRGSGQMDQAGWLYLACDQSNTGAFYPSVHLFDAGGVLQRIVAVPWVITDAAPSPDGSTIYVARWSDHTIYRLVGSRTAGYSLDTGWKLQNLPAGGVANRGALVRGEYVATDASGSIYVSSGTWTNPGNHLADYTDRWDTARVGTTIAKTIVKFDANGTYITNFGSVANAADDANSWDPGVAYTQWTGLAVTADGARVFVADENNSRVHRFDAQPNGTYVVGPVFGESKTTNAARDGNCFTPGSLAAPYDLTLSRGGELLVMNTSCRYNTVSYRAMTGEVAPYSVEIQRFDQNGGARGVIHAVSPWLGIPQPDGSMAGNYTAATCPDLAKCLPYPVHGISLDCTGAIHLPQANEKLVPSASWSDAGAGMGKGGALGSNAACISAGAPTGDIPGGPDTIKPSVDAFAATQIGTSLDVAITVRAHDNVAVTDYHLYDAQTDRGWGYAPTATLTVAGYGTRVLNVQVRDAAGNISDWVPVTVRLVAPGTGDAAKPGAGAGHAKSSSVAAVAKFDSAVNANSPTITAVLLPPSTTTGRIAATVRAKDRQGGKLFARVADENGRWGARHAIGKVAVPLSFGRGWKGVFFQVIDAQGNKSRMWFQPVLSAPRHAAWLRGSQAADRLKGSAKADFIDLSSFDGTVDRVACGRGIDTVLLQREDIAAKDCERVVRVRMPTA